MSDSQHTEETTPLRSAKIEAAATTSVMLAPWGQVHSTNGNFIVDEESATQAVDAFNAHGTDLPIDYEHQTLGGSYAAPNGQAPAAGWITKLVVTPDVGLLGEISWTTEAQDMIASRQYRYLSPVAIIRKKDRKLVAIHSAALTNKPAIIGMKPIVNRHETHQQDHENEPLNCLRTELDLPSEASEQTVLTAAAGRLADLTREAKARQVDQRIDDALRRGRLTPAQRNWAAQLICRAEDLFDLWLNTAPVVVPTGKMAPPDNDDLHTAHNTLAARARAEYHTSKLIRALTSEEAYVADAIEHANA